MARIVRLRRGRPGARGDLRQDRIADLLIGLGDQRGADSARRIAASRRRSGGGASAPAPGRREEIAQHVEDVLGVVFQAELDDHEVDDVAVFRGQAVGAADAGVVGAVVRQRHGDAAFAEIDLDEPRPLDPLSGSGKRVANIERGVRPRRLGQIFDRRRDLLVALDEQDVAGLRARGAAYRRRTACRARSPKDSSSSRLARNLPIRSSSVSRVSVIRSSADEYDGTRAGFEASRPTHRGTLESPAAFGSNRDAPFPLTLIIRLIKYPPWRETEPRPQASSAEHDHAALIRAALKLFGRQGFDGTSTREIAAEANANIGSIAYHFGGKEGLRAASADYIVETIQAIAARRSQPDARRAERRGGARRSSTARWSAW